ncbi:hypothetical protein WMF38_07515 [Sorangium sp. So ce118]
MATWCCGVFEQYHKNAGLRGIGVYATNSGDGRIYFHLEFRAADRGTAVKVSSSGEVPVSTTTRTGISFCPWCGLELRKSYKDASQLVRDDLEAVTG